jgi:hypothetical protein
LLEFLARVIRQGKEIKGIQIGKAKKVKLTFFADDTNLYLKIPKDSNRKLLDLMNPVSKVTQFKINL